MKIICKKEKGKLNGNGKWKRNENWEGKRKDEEEEEEEEDEEEEEEEEEGKKGGKEWEKKEKKNVITIDICTACALHVIPQWSRSVFCWWIQIDT